jgi:hypothetical protein
MLIQVFDSDNDGEIDYREFVWEVQVRRLAPPPAVQFSRHRCHAMTMTSSPAMG